MSKPSTTRISPQRGRLAGLAIAVAVALTPAAEASAQQPTSKRVEPSEQRREFPMQQIIERAEALEMPQHATPAAAGIASERPSGPRISVPGVAPKQAAAAIQRTAGMTLKSSRRLRQNGAWTGPFNANPNLQVGKLFFDVKPGPGKVWSHCSATAVNSENRSLVITAGHCVYDHETASWSEHVQFCPGYERRCALGVWHARTMYTTNRWYYGQDWADDAAVVLVDRNRRGLLVDAVGGQGINFNDYVGLARHAFGYPAADRRWPAYRYDGEDLIYCPGADRYSAGVIVIGCTMTGGASGGPWLSGFGLNGMGYVNGVNSHKPGSRKASGKVVASPYFDAGEAELFQSARAA
jgi:V8-like Glu-specific endopeptidase